MPLEKEANKSIVTVTGVKSDTDWFNNPYESKGQASGIIVAENSRELLVLTERKAIADAQEIYVTFINDVSVKAEMKKYDGNTGIAVLSVKTSELTESTKNAITVAVLGNSLTVTRGNDCDCNRKSAWNKLFDTDRKYHIYDK